MLETELVTADDSQLAIASENSNKIMFNLKTIGHKQIKQL